MVNWKNLLLSCVLFFGSQTINAQVKDSVTSGSYLGIHVNELVRQLMPTGSSSVNNNFNYLVTFIKYKPGHKRGTRMSGNFIFNSISDNVSGTSRLTNNNIVQYKVGKEKLYIFDKRFSFAYGVDFLVSLNNSITNVNSSTISGAFNSRIGNTVTTAGAGPGLRLVYNVTPRILLGTDAGAYFTATATTVNISSTSPGQPFQTRTSDSKVNYTIGLSPPISLYFILKVR